MLCGPSTRENCRELTGGTEQIEHVVEVAPGGVNLMHVIVNVLLRIFGRLGPAWDGMDASSGLLGPWIGMAPRRVSLFCGRVAVGLLDVS